MERVIDNEMAKFLICAGAALAALGALFFTMVDKAKGSVKPYVKPTLLYMLVALVFFMLIPLVIRHSLIPNLEVAFILYQVYFLLLGLAHQYYMQRLLLWSTGPKAFYLQIVFTLLLSAVCAVAFALIYKVVHHNGMQLLITASILLFIVPLLLFQTFREAISIPAKVVKEWFYPVGGEVEEPEDAKMKNLLVISFEFKKQTEDPHFTNFRARAPVDMEFGKLFYFFINDYNERHPSGRIHFVNGAQEPHGWIFYKKPKWSSVVTRYIDGEKTIFNNRIRENDVIICERSLI